MTYEELMEANEKIIAVQPISNERNSPNEGTGRLFSEPIIRKNKRDCYPDNSGQQSLFGKQKIEEPVKEETVTVRPYV